MGFLSGLFGGFSSGGIASGNDKSTTTNTTDSSNTARDIGNTATSTTTDATNGGFIGNTIDARTIDNGTTSMQYEATYTNNTTNSNAQNWVSDNDNIYRLSDSSTRNTTSTATNSGNTTNTWTSTDGGAFDTLKALGGKQLDMAASIINNTVTGAGNVVEAAFDAVAKNTQQAFSFSGSSQAAAYASSAQALGMANKGFDRLAELASDVVQQATKQTADASKQAQTAYQGAADTANGTRTILIAGGVAVVLFLIQAWRSK